MIMIDSQNYTVGIKAMVPEFRESKDENLRTTFKLQECFFLNADDTKFHNSYSITFNNGSCD